MAKTRLTSEIMGKVVEKFKGAKIEIRKFYIQYSQDSTYRKKISMPFYVCVIKLKGVETVCFTFTEPKDGFADTWLYFLYEGWPMHLNVSNDEDGSHASDHHFTAEVVWINENGANKSVLIAQKNFKFVDGTTNTPIDLKVPTNIWKMGKAPSCNEIVLAWPKVAPSMPQNVGLG